MYAFKNILILFFMNFRNLNVYFFYLFLLSAPFQTRKVFLTQYSYYTGAFTEYSAFYVYASDVILVLAILLWLLFDEKIKGDLSGFSYRFKAFILSGGKFKFRVTDSAVSDKISTFSSVDVLYLFLACFDLWLIIDLSIRSAYFEISFYQTVKMFELSMLAIYVSRILAINKYLITSLYMLVIAGFVQSIIGISQFILQHSVFGFPILQKITGESIVSDSILGAAKLSFEGGKVLRAYGTLPHPNVLAGLLVITIGISLFLYLHHNRASMSSTAVNALHNDTDSAISQVIDSNLHWIVVISIQVIALMFTFSRSGWTALIFFIIISVVLLVNHKKNVSRETFPSNSYTITYFSDIIRDNLKVATGLCIIIMIVGIVSLINLPLLNSRIAEDLIANDVFYPSNFAINDRLFFNNVSRETIYKSPITGSGLGTYIFQINNFVEANFNHDKLLYWQYQPDHNLYFLVASEIGLVGLTIFLLIVCSLLRLNLVSIYSAKHQRLTSGRNVSRETFHFESTMLQILMVSLLMSMLFISIFDHYFWTLQQGRLTFWLLVGVMIVAVDSKRLESEINKVKP